MKIFKVLTVASFILASIGMKAQTWNTNGNIGTNPATEFIGTTNNSPLIFKTNNTFSGMLGGFVTSFGLNSCQGGHVSNTAFGENALSLTHTHTFSSGGGGNTAVGHSALMNNVDGGSNVAVGESSLRKNNIGQLNVAVGKSSLYSNTSGNQNVGIGTFTLQSNTTGQSNIGIGYKTLESNTLGNYNIGLGDRTLLASNGSMNIAIGTFSGLSISTGNNNSFIGNDAGRTLTSGSNNTFIGNNSGYNITSGNNNIIFGGYVASPSTSISNTIIMSTGSNAERFRIDSNGNMGLNTTSPGNRMEIKHGANGNSGLRFTNLTNATAPITNPSALANKGVLSVNATGDVILVTDQSGGVSNSCTTQYNVPTTIGTSGNLSCGQIYDNGNTVSIGTVLTTPSAVTYTLGAIPPFSGGTVPLSGTIKLDVNGTIRTTGIFATSDKKFKKNIVTIENALDIVENLEGKTYNWKKESNKEMNFDDNIHSGFIAQEIEKVLPHLVATSVNGEKSVNYQELTPYLVEAIKEQQNQIIALNNKIEDLISKNILAENKITDGKTYFSSNYPNPFETTTKIDYFIDKNIKDAQIIVYDYNGTTISKYELKERGVESNFSINKGSLKTGIYFYTLITDGIVIGTKKLIAK
jgi:hypothetical protein